MNLKIIIEEIYHKDFFGRMFHTLVYCLKRELKDCQSVLDLGCGPFSPLKYCDNIEYSVGVELYKPYLLKSKMQFIHTKYLNKGINEIDFPPDSFDAVIMIELIEHLTKREGIKLVKKAEKWAKKKIVITTPNGYFPMGDVDKNPWQKHLSGWSVNEFRKLRFRCFGLAGLKFFYHNENKVASLIGIDNDSTFANIRFQPKTLFYLVNSFFQIFSYYLPKIAFELFAVKNV